MKATNWMTVIVLAGGLALGQAPSGAKSPAKPASQAPPAATAKAPAKASPAPKAAAQKPSAPAKAAATKPPTAAKSTAAKSKAPVAAKMKGPTAAKTVTAKKEKAPAAAQPVEAKGISTPGKRDPFVSVIVARGGPSADCSGGKRCLVPEQIALRGIIKTPTKWIAMIETPAKKTYYLYENDAIYNGVVAKITGDSVVFRVQALDNLGHTVPQDIVKRVNAPVI
jgi:hypothetical protein